MTIRNPRSMTTAVKAAKLSALLLLPLLQVTPARSAPGDYNPVVRWSYSGMLPSNGNDYSILPPEPPPQAQWEIDYDRRLEEARLNPATPKPVIPFPKNPLNSPAMQAMVLANPFRMLNFSYELNDRFHQYPHNRPVIIEFDFLMEGLHFPTWNVQDPFEGKRIASPKIMHFELHIFESSARPFREAWAKAQAQELLGPIREALLKNNRRLFARLKADPQTKPLIDSMLNLDSRPALQFSLDLAFSSEVIKNIKLNQPEGLPFRNALYFAAGQNIPGYRIPGCTDVVGSDKLLRFTFENGFQLDLTFLEHSIRVSSTKSMTANEWEKSLEHLKTMYEYLGKMGLAPTKDPIRLSMSLGYFVTRDHQQGARALWNTAVDYLNHPGFSVALGSEQASERQAPLPYQLPEGQAKALSALHQNIAKTDKLNMRSLAKALNGKASGMLVQGPLAIQFENFSPSSIAPWGNGGLGPGQDAKLTFGNMTTPASADAWIKIIDVLQARVQAIETLPFVLPLDPTKRVSSRAEAARQFSNYVGGAGLDPLSARSALPPEFRRYVSASLAAPGGPGGPNRPLSASPQWICKLLFD